MAPAEAELHFSTDQVHLSASANDVEDSDLSKASKYPPAKPGALYCEPLKGIRGR